ncbi:penicillin acylase family protein [Streptomyces sp. NPDC006879]|uniref:penicillin acylase family protein n=1 Tax=Streptomyces sp. NPDC006879 TaxID=3364767 RepID=UPI0036AA3345
MSFEVYRDDWGVPHLSAPNPRELARAQGRITALDRAWQLEVERHRAQGATAAFLGPESVAWDRFARQARLADTARRCHAALDPETADWLQAYVDGVNDALPGAAHLDPRFAETDLTPTPWQPWVPLGIWISTHILFAGFPTKLWRDRVAATLGEELIDLFATDGPAVAGSNGWLIPGHRTTSGSALLAGDPHRFIEDPGVYQQIRLSCPQYDVLGLAVPGVPGLAHFGHTGTVAWAITNAMADFQDLYRERLRRNPNRPTGAGTPPGPPLIEALGPDGAWEAAEWHTETIEVAGGDAIEIEVIETARGPVIADETESGRPGEALTLRYPPRVRADLGFAALPALLRARTVADVDRAFDHWAEPVNVVQAADTSGGLLHRIAGTVPLRHAANRLRPVPAWEGEHRWHGWADSPRTQVRDVAVMANQRGIAAPLGIEFAPPHRADRISELLDSRSLWSPDDMEPILTDTHLGSAQALLSVVSTLDGLSPAAESLRRRLLDWDQMMAADSTDATCYSALRSAVVRALASDPAFTHLTEPPVGHPVFLPWLHLLPRIGYALEGILTTGALPELDRAGHVRAALEEVAARPDEPAPWAQVHRLAAWQALPQADPDWPGLAGDHDCVLCTSSVPGVTDLSARGPAARFVWDLHRRENSRWVVPLGASGIPGHPHHRDQMSQWVDGELLPVTTDWSQLTKEDPR